MASSGRSAKTIYARICKYFTYFSLSFCIILGLDLLLPAVVKQEKIIYRATEEYAHRSKYRGYVVTKSDASVIITENFIFPAPRGFQVTFGKNDSLEIHASPILRLVKSGLVKKDGKEYSIKPHTSILDVFMFVPIVLFGTSVVGVIYRNHLTTIIDVGTVNIILFLIILKILRVFF